MTQDPKAAEEKVVLALKVYLVVKTHVTEDRCSPIPATSTKFAEAWLISYQIRQCSNTKAVVPQTKSQK